MFAFSFQKLLVLAAIVAAIWYGFRWVGRLQKMRDAEQKLRRQEARGAARGASAKQEPPAEDMVQCPRCQAYLPATRPLACGRADCPY